MSDMNFNFLENSGNTGATRMFARTSTDCMTDMNVVMSTQTKDLLVWHHVPGVTMSADNVRQRKNK